MSHVAARTASREFHTHASAHLIRHELGVAEAMNAPDSRAWLPWLKDYKPENS